MRTLIAGWAVVALLAGSPLALAGQHGHLQTVSPTHPTARSVAGLVELLVHGKREEAQVYLAEHGAPEQLQALTGALPGLVAHLSGGGYRIRDFLRSPHGGLLVRLDGVGEPELLLVDVDESPPHLIRAVNRARMRPTS